MIPLLLASVSAVITSYLFLGSEILFSFEIQDRFSIDDILFYVVLGIGSAVASVYFSKMYFCLGVFGWAIADANTTDGPRTIR